MLTSMVGFAVVLALALVGSGVTTGMIYRGIIPFVGLQVIAIAIMFMVPGLATWLPRAIY